MARVAVVGGGPGGLMTARLLEAQAPRAEITIYEAGERLGGKLHTRRFHARDVAYESGVAECYDVEAHGPDPLKDLVRDLGLAMAPTAGTTVFLGDSPVRNDDDLGRILGPRALAAVRRFRARVTALLPPERWARGPDAWDHQHPWAALSWEDVLEREAPDPGARQYLRVVAHSDLAAEPHEVSGITGARVFLRSVEGYGRVYTLADGMGALPQALAAALGRVVVRTTTEVLAIDGRDAVGYTLSVRSQGRLGREHADAVVLALPMHRLAAIGWPDATVRQAVRRHLARYERPAHYLRVSLLFDRPFWLDCFTGAWTMLDAFDGCCVYDSSPPASGAGVLGFLLAGASAARHANERDDVLIARVVSALPSPLRQPARRRLLEARVHRWANCLSATPGGARPCAAADAHQIESCGHAGLAVVGDYLIDSTLNGLLRSAEHVARQLASRCAADAARRTLATDPAARTPYGTTTVCGAAGTLVPQAFAAATAME